MRPRHFLAIVGLGAMMAAASAHAATPDDPFERINRRAYESSMGADRSVFLPLAKLYHWLTPGPLGAALHNFVTNLSEPAIVANDLLQVRISRAARDVARIVLDTTIGLGGLIDVAGPAGAPHEDNDFGVTLGRWGVGPGPYLYLPVLGPSTVRDALGMGVDAAMNPLNYVRFPGRLTLDVSSSVVGGLDLRFRSQADMDALLGGAADPYATLRSVYLQNRQAEVRGETSATTPPLPTLEDIPSAPSSDAQPAAPASPPPAGAAPKPDAGSQAAAVGDLDRPMATAQPWDRIRPPVALALAGD